MNCDHEHNHQHTSPEDLLKHAGLKVTRQRAAILSVLQEATGSLTADEIFLTLKQNDQTFGLSTVYRALSSLEEHDLVCRSDLPGSSQCYFLKTAEHRHRLVCVRCKHSILLDGCPVEQFAAKVGGENGFLITGHSFEIFGICPDCQREAAHV